MSVMSRLRIDALSESPRVIALLGEILTEVVAHGGSVGFMHPLEEEAARTFWSAALKSARLGERVVLGAWDGDVLAGTVSILLNCPPNQPHRAEIAKMMTRVSHRGRGVALELLRAAEGVAAERGRRLLVLDTASDGGASGLYESQGFVYAGEIPDYALKPHGGLTGTRLYWKRIGAAAG
jgi:ribosomal protein S18 acetylase RimI-like enzyme